MNYRRWILVAILVFGIGIALGPILCLAPILTLSVNGFTPARGNH